MGLRSLWATHRCGLEGGALAGSEPGDVLGLAHDAKTGLHAVVAESADLAAEDGVVAGFRGGEVEFSVHAGDGVLLEAHAGDEEAVNDVEGAEAEIDWPAGGKDEDGGDDVV